MIARSYDIFGFATIYKTSLSHGGAFPTCATAYQHGGIRGENAREHHREGSCRNHSSSAPSAGWYENLWAP